MTEDQIQVEEIDDDQLDSYLDRQIETYFHTQKRAERLIQLLIAVSAIVITFTSEGVLRRLTNYLQSIETGGPFYFGDNVTNLAEIGTPLAILIITLAAIILFDSILWSFDVLMMPKLNSQLGAEKAYSTELPLVSEADIKDLEYGVNPTYNDKVRADLKFNSNLLGKMGLYMTNSYNRLLIALGLLASSLILVFGDLTQNPLWIILFCLLYVLFGTVYSLKKLDMKKVRGVLSTRDLPLKYGFHTALYVTIWVVASIGYVLSFVTLLLLLLEVA